MTPQQQSALEEARAEAVQQGVLKAERERSMVRNIISLSYIPIGSAMARCTLCGITDTH